MMNEKQTEIVTAMIQSIAELSDNENIYDDTNKKSYSQGEIKKAFPEIYGAVMDDNYKETICPYCGSHAVHFSYSDSHWDDTTQEIIGEDYILMQACSGNCGNTNDGSGDTTWVSTKRDESSDLYYAVLDIPHHFNIKLPFHRLPSREAAIRFARNHIRQSQQQEIAE